jgi:hypothetical protein
MVKEHVQGLYVSKRLLFVKKSSISQKFHKKKLVAGLGM